MDALLFPALVLGAMYFLLIRPQQKRAKAQRELLSRLDVGDKIITVGGIVGRIVELHDRELVLETETTRLRLVRGSVGSTVPPDAPAEIEDLDGPDSAIS